MPDSIGQFAFLTLSRADGQKAPPNVTKFESEVIQRPGIDGSGIRNLGKKGKPFQMVGMVDCVDQYQATYLYDQYCDRIGQGTTLIFQGVDYGALGQGHMILDVDVTEITPVRNAVGTLNGVSNCVVVKSIWTLLPVKL